jgi:hypothetical protein
MDKLNYKHKYKWKIKQEKLNKNLQDRHLLLDYLRPRQVLIIKAM